MFIITGGGSGLGKALAIALAGRGQSVLIVGRRQKLLEETAAVSPLIDSFCADVSTDEGINSLAQHLDSVPHLSALVNNAGTLKPITPLLSVSAKEWQQALNTNLDAALFLSQKLYPKLRQGRVLNIGSGAAYFAIKGWAAYCVSKAALSMLTQCWQLESKEVAFASVMPGIADTDMQALAREGTDMDEEQTAFYQNLKYTNRLIPADTVAEFLVWLLLDIDSTRYQSKEWDIYDTSHHGEWLHPPHHVIHWES